ncbi:hypothetical protein CH298_04275 [Rhodococcoides fascians]|uniref:hypothetical protein n=1 Tax=Rhodococcoides fascians TaxID=1828 RepID=UPI000B9BF202|nr:hypothetical protein [Rhodococcus fascians]OZE92722.1 hypothetical protein CH303_04270 [Rhodococcus fascians]OZF23355.1 hypothetical protein CH298_04275 [Rhodococcus fascians]OZF25068.1 hypothetical protein CH297_04270 [Rhodococcus fascians]OZF72664.1 hypothetical protein CH308_04275 [Rhodococcus fascians]OZF73963.1 hypothetical protein CH307_04275 [Rhodococcus fascians]
MAAPATPPPAHPDSVPSLEEFRTFVGAQGDTHDTALGRDLAAAVEMLDDFCSDPYRLIPVATRKRWYLSVGAEIFDQNAGPSTYTDRFENVVQARSSRDPMNVVIREVRRYVSPF